MKHYFIVNPLAGQKKAARYIPLIHSYCQEHAIPYEVLETSDPAAAQSAIRARLNTEEPLRFYACGGDGTISCVISTIAAAGKPNVSVGIIPAGTGNDFIRSLPDPALQRSIAAQIGGESSPIDLIRVQDSYSINMLNIGLDCDAADMASELKKKPLISGSMAYVLGLINRLCKPLGTSLTLTFDDEETIHGDYLLGTIANGRYYGGGWHAAPLSKLDDGLLDVALITKVPRYRFLHIIPSYHSGTYLPHQIETGLVTYRQCHKVRIVADTPQNICVDGDIRSFEDITVEVCPKAIQLIIPKKDAPH